MGKWKELSKRCDVSFNSPPSSFLSLQSLKSVKFNPLTNIRAGPRSLTNINVLAPVMRLMAREVQQEEEEEEVVVVVVVMQEPWSPPPRPTDHLNITELPHKKITESFMPAVGRLY